MITKNLCVLACGFSLALLGGCGAKESNAASPEAGPASQPSAQATATIYCRFPEDGSKVFTNCDVLPFVADAAQGSQVRVLVDRDAVSIGGQVADAAATIREADRPATLDLSPGQHKVTLQLTDADGISLGADKAASITVNAVAAPPVRKVWFIEPQDGATVATTFKVRFGLEGLGLVPKMTETKDKTKGHHHIIVDGGPIPYGSIVPADATHIHYGGGQAEAELTLPVGKHTLTMQFADGNHYSYGPALAATITVEVKGD